MLGQTPSPNIAPQNDPIELEIIYRDDYFIAVNKPAGMLVHRSWLDKYETQFVMQTLRDQIGQHVFPVHRLDKPTSGVLLFALSSEVASKVMPIFANHEMHKRYFAIVRGWILQGEVLDYPIKDKFDKVADKHSSKEKEAKEAVTEYQPLAHVEVPYPSGKFSTSRYSLVEMLPKTGRKHQLRRHMHHLSHPIIGDTSYGDGVHNRIFREHYNSHRLLLHAAELSFIHPYTRQSIAIKASFDQTWLYLFNAFDWNIDLVEGRLTSKQ